MKTLRVSGCYYSHFSFESYFRNSAVLNSYGLGCEEMVSSALAAHLAEQRLEWMRDALASHDCPMTLSAFSFREGMVCELERSQSVEGSTEQTRLIVIGRAEHWTHLTIG